MKKPSQLPKYELQALLKILRYNDGKRRNAVARKAFLHWRAIQDPPIPLRCDVPNCRFHSGELEWNGKPLPLILAHSNGVNTDNRVSNLLLLCPNCDAQDASTRGGANRGRVKKSSGGFAITERGKPKAYHLPAETYFLEVHGQEVRLHGSAGTK